MMRNTSLFNRLLSLALSLCMVLSLIPGLPLAAQAAVCTCGTDDAAIHATNCPVYVAPEEPQCLCAEKCTQANIWCDVCGFDFTACSGQDTAAMYLSDPTHTRDGYTVTMTAATYRYVAGSNLVKVNDGMPYLERIAIRQIDRNPAANTVRLWVMVEFRHNSIGCSFYHPITITEGPCDQRIDQTFVDLPAGFLETDEEGNVITHDNSVGTFTVTREAKAHTGGTPTCSTAAVCTVCGTSYKNENNHSWSVWSSVGANHVRTCSDCGDVESGAHSGGTFTCAGPATCSVCKLPYSGSGSAAHNPAVAFVNGFCPNGCYESAVLNGDVYEIGNAGQLYWFGQQVNSGNTAINGVLTADIVVNEGTMTAGSTDARVWTPIGYANNYYAGTFDGCDFTVSGLYFNNSGTTDVGLFGCVSGGTVKNVGVLDSYLSGKWYVGGVVGYIDKGTVEGCYNSGTVSGIADVGGVVGWANTDSTVTGCYNSGNVSGSGDYVGGVTGYIKSGTVTNSYNSGSVSGSGNYVGGVTGYIKNGTVEHCYNTGAVSGSGNYIGGVAGSNEGDSFTALSDVMGCYNSGTVSGNGNHVGSVVGYKNSCGFVTNCYYLADSETDSIDDTTFKTAEQFASGEVAYLLQGQQETHIWGQNIGTDAYPVLGGRKVLFDQETNTYYNDAATLGDLDLDGDVDANDLTLLARHVGGIELLTGTALQNGDVNGDGGIDANDLTKHARFVGGIITDWDQE